MRDSSPFVSHMAISSDNHSIQNLEWFYIQGNNSLCISVQNNPCASTESSIPEIHTPSSCNNGEV